MFQIHLIQLLNREGDTVDTWFTITDEATNETRQFRNWDEVEYFIETNYEK